MLPRLARCLLYPLNRCLLAALILAVTWIVWHHWPLQPIRTWTFDRVVGDGAVLAADGQTALLFCRVGPERPEPIPGQTRILLCDRVRLVDLATGRDLLPDRRAMFGCLFDRGQRLAVLRPDLHIDTYRASDGQFISTIAPPTKRFRFIREVPAGRELLLYEWDMGGGAVYEFWDAEAGQRLWQLPFKVDLEWAGQHVVVKSEDAIRVHDVRTGRELGRWPEPMPGVVKLTIAPDGQRLAVLAPQRSRLRVVSLPSFATINEFIVSGSFSVSLTDMEFSPRGRYLRWALRGENECLWDVQTGQKLLVDETEHSAYFAPDDLHQVTFNRNSAISFLRRIPDTAGLILGSYRSGPIVASPDGQRLAINLQIEPSPQDRLDAIWQFIFKRPFHARYDFVSVVTDLPREQIVRSIPGDQLLGFGGNDTIWTMLASADDIHESHSIRLQQWSLDARVPWYLWTLTALVALLILFTLRRRRRFTR